MTTQSPGGDHPPVVTVIASLTNGNPWTRPLACKVPRVTALFWTVTILATTLGATAADSLSADLRLGLSATTAIMSLLLTSALLWQLSMSRHVPGSYWLAVILAGVVSTLFSDNLVENLGMRLWTATAVPCAVLTLLFAGWYRSEHSVSAHGVLNRRREAWYWAAVLGAVSVGSSGADLVSEKLDLGHLTAALIFGFAVALIAVAHFRLEVDAVLAFWAAYITSGAFGSSIGDLLSAAPKGGGLGLGTNRTSAIIVGVILVLVGSITANAHRSDRGLHHARA